MQGVSSNVIRIESSSARNGIRPNSTISFALPAATIGRLSTFQIHGKFSTTGASKLPDDIMMLVQRCECSANGVLISGGSTYYNTIRALKKALTGKRADRVRQHGSLITTDMVGNAYTGSTGETSIASIGGWDYGLLACDTDYVDTELIGNIVIKITLASPDVLIGAGATYTVDDVYATMECISINNPLYDSMISQQLSTAGYVPITFPEAQCTKSTHNTLTRVNCSSRSLRRIMVGFKHKNMDVAGPEVLTSGGKETIWDGTIPDGGAFVEKVAKDGNPYTATAPCNVFGSATQSSAASIMASDDSAYFDMGGSRFPQFEARLGNEWIMLRKQALYHEELHDELIRKDLCGTDIFDVANVLAAKLSLSGSASSTLASGIDSRGAAVTLSVNTTGTIGQSTNTVCYFCTETDSLLQVGSQRQIALLR